MRTVAAALMSAVTVMLRMLTLLLMAFCLLSVVLGIVGFLLTNVFGQCREKSRDTAQQSCDVRGFQEDQKSPSA